MKNFLCAGPTPILHECENLLGPNLHREVEDKKRQRDEFVG